MSGQPKLGETTRVFVLATLVGSWEWSTGFRISGCYVRLND